MFKIAYDASYCHKLPEGHRFPMLKYELIPEQLIYEGLCTEANFFSPTDYSSNIDLEKYILLTHTKTYYDDLINLRISPKMERRIGFPLSKELVERELLITLGTIQCGVFATQNGVAFNVAGGTHHAYTDRGEGFCLLNDVGVAATYLLDKKIVKKILIIDLDVHQGNGSAQIFQDNPYVFTFSMHGAENYPLKKEISDLDIALPTYSEDEAYLRILKKTLPQLIEKEKPDFAFFIAGVDVLKTDKLGKLSLSLEGCKERDVLVFELLNQKDIPVVVTMGGGYSPKIADIVEAHCNTYRVAERIYCKP